MEKFIKYVSSIVANSTLQEKEKNKLLRFIEMVKKLLILKKLKKENGNY